VPPHPQGSSSRENHEQPRLVQEENPASTG
jgi:hypothetical protein